MIRRECCPHFERELQLVLRYFIDEGVYPEGCLIVSVDSVVHDQELTIWRVNCKCFHCLEVPHIYALVKIAIIKDNGSELLSITLAHCEVIIKDESEFRIPVQVALHLNDSINRAINHIPI